MTIKAMIERLAAYNVWAHQQQFDTIHQLSEEQVYAIMPCSFPGIYKTVLHLWDAESIWWQRLKLQDQVEPPGKTFNGSLQELEDKLMQQSLQWEEWVKHASELQLTHVFAYQNSKKEQFKQPVHEVLLHLFNHATYHRGQLVAMFHQLGIKKIPSTDFIHYSRSKK